MSSNEIKTYINAGNAGEDDIKDLTRLLDQKQISYSFSSDRTLVYTKADLYETKQRRLRKVPLLTYKEAFDYAPSLSSIAIPIIYDWWKERKSKKRRKKRTSKEIKVRYKDLDGTVFELTKKESEEG